MNEDPLIIEKISITETVCSTEIVQYLKLSRQIPQVLTNVINQKIIEKTAIEKEITIKDEELQTAADRFRYQNNLISSQETLRWLKKYRLSVNEFEILIKNDYLKQKLATELFASQVENYFYTHQVDYNLAIIYQVILTDYNLAMELFYAVQAQELSFWELAHQYIQDPDSRRLGGYQGMKNRTQLQPEIAAAIFALQPGDLPQILKPISLDKQVYLIYVEEIIQPDLTPSLAQEIITKLFENWLNKQSQSIINNLKILD